MTKPGTPRHSRLVLPCCALGPDESGHNRVPQIIPVRISLLDEFELPRSPPFLDRLLPRDRRRHVGEQLEVNQPMDLILFRETIPLIVSMFPNPLHQVAGDTDVECPVSLARENIDRGLFLHRPCILDSRFRGNDDDGEAEVMRYALDKSFYVSWFLPFVFQRDP